MKDLFRNWLENHDHIRIMFFSPRARHIWPSALLLVLVFAVVSALVLVGSKVACKEISTLGSFVSAMVSSPGTVFAIAAAAISAWGFLYTASRLHEDMGAINSYAELLVEARKMIQDEVREAEAEGRRATLRFVCTTPLNGNISASVSQEYKDYRECLENACKKHILKIIRPPVSQIRQFYDRFRIGVSAEMPDADKVAVNTHNASIDQAYKETMDFFEGMARVNRNQRAGVDDRGDQHVILSLLSEIDDEVGYRFLLTRNKALFYVPLFLPPYASGQQENAGSPQSKASKAGSVELYGFVRTDRLTKNQLIRNFDFLTEQAVADSPGGKIPMPGGTLAINITRPRGDNGCKDGVLWVHSLTTFIGDHQEIQRRTFRLLLAKHGFASVEFDYRYRGGKISHKDQLPFSLVTASQDVNTVLEYLMTQKPCPGIDRWWIVGRGMAAYVALGSTSARHYKCPIVTWQPMFHPKRTMTARGHVKAFSEVYVNAVGHEYVEVEGVRLGEAFFSQLADSAPANVWDSHMVGLYTRGDSLTKPEWVEEFATQVNAQQGRACPMQLQMLDKDSSPVEHSHDSDLYPFFQPTLITLQTEVKG